MRNFFGNIGDQSFEAMRLAGVGWIFAFFIVGATILGARWLIGWQMRRIEQIMARKPDDGDEANSDNNGNPKV